MTSAVRSPAAVCRPNSGTNRLRAALLASCARGALLAVPLALSLGVTLPGSAQAGTGIGSSSSEVDLTAVGPAYNPFYINNGTTISSPTLGIYGSTESYTIVNSGTITTGSTGIAIELRGESVITNTNSGIITGGDYGLRLSRSGGGLSTVVNLGIITASSEIGVAVLNGGTVTNDASGYINGAESGVKMLGTGSLTNAGTVIGGTADGIYLQRGTVTNTGNVQGGGTNGAGVRIFYGSGFVTNGNTGVISGGYYGVEMSTAVQGASTLVNDGTITATSTHGSAAGVFFGNGGTLTNNASGRIIGGVYGLRLFGTSTVTNAGTIITTGEPGVYMQKGGTLTNSGTASYIRGGSNGGVFTNDGGLTIINDGRIIDKNPSYTAAGVFLYWGGKITNDATGTISGIPNGVSIARQNGTVDNAGLITGGRGVSVRTGVTGVVSNTGTIAGTSSIGVYLGQGGTVTNSGTGLISGVTDGVSIAGAAGTVTNSATIIGSGGSGIGVLFAGSFADTLINSGTIIGNSGTAVRFGNGNDLLQLDPGATFVGTVDGGGGTNQLELAAGAGTGNLAGLGTSFINFGSVTVDNGASWQFNGNNQVAIGVTLANAGTLTNDGTLTNAGSLTNTSTFVNAGLLTNTGTLVNSGMLTNTGTLVSTGTLSNGGLLSNSNAGTVVGTVTLTGMGSLLNSGTITSTGAAVAGSGSTAALITNHGLIQTTGASAIAIDLSGGSNSTIDNFGTIASAGTTAIAFGGGSNELVIESGSSITGAVVGQAAASNAAIFVGTGTLAQGQLINFQNLSFEDASWTLAASETLSNVGVTVDNGTLANAGTVTGTVAVGNGGTLSNTGMIETTVTLTNGGMLTNDGQIAGGIGVAGTDGVLANSGTITGTSGSGVALSGAGMVTNTGVGLIQGATYGVALAAGGTVTNAGTILDGATAGAALGTGATLVNQSGGLVSGVTGVIMTGAASVTNAGTIAGSGGTAVQFSAAGGTLTLQTGSVLAGAIDGGGGDGSVILTGSGSSANDFNNFGSGGSLTLDGTAWTLAGTVAIANTTVEAGALTVTGSLAGTEVNVQAGASLLGTGSIAGALDNAGTLVPGGLGTIGTLKLTGNFTQTATGVLETSLNGAGEASLLQITGTAKLAGSVLLLPVGSGFVNGTRYTLLTASSGVSGSFAGISTVSPLLSSTLSYDTDDAYVTLGQLSVTQGLNLIGGTRNETQTAAGFDEAESAETGTYAASLAALDQLSAAGLRHSLDQLSGEIYTGLATTALVAGGQFLDQIDHQGALARLGDDPAALAAAGGGTRVQLASLTGNTADPAATMDRPWGVWASGYGQTGEIAGDGNSHQLNETISGAAVGADYRLGALRVGTAVGAASTNFSLNDEGSRADINQTQIALYADYAPGPAYLFGTLGFAYGEGTVNRDVSLPGQRATASGHATSYQGMGAFEAGYGMALSRRAMVTPFARLAVDAVHQNSLSETDAGALDLSVADQSASSVTSTLGARFTDRVPLAGIKLAVNLSLGWLHEYASTQRTATVAFSADPASGFQVDGAQPARDSAIIGAGLATALSASTSLYLRYDGAISGPDTSHAVSAGFRFIW